MIRFIKLFMEFLVFILFMGSFAFPLGGKIPEIPMKPYPVTEIKDGEFLHYGMYQGGEKTIDEYFVTIKEKKADGGFYYRVYEDIISPMGGRKLPENYTKWPVSVLIDPVRCSAIISEANLSTNELKDFANFGVGGMIYSHYQFYPDKGIVKYTSKSIRSDEIFTKSYTINVNPNFPTVDAFSTSFVYRLIDPHSPGIFYYVIPDFMKEPFPLTFRYDRKETVTTKAGKFHVTILIVAMGDPFIGKLMEPFLKNLSLMIEDSDRRVAVKQIMSGSETVLEEISNVIIR